MSFVNTGFQQDFRIGAVPLQADNIQRTGTAFDDFIIIIDNGHIMLFRGQMLRELVSDLAGSDDNDPHKGPPSEIKEIILF